MEEKSEIKTFYEGKNVFITGGTGFMGKILVEKLLRSTNVATVYLLMREKKGKDVYTRLDELFDNIVFERLKNEVPKFKHRVVGIPGDCSISGLGLTIKDRQKLQEEIDVVFHCAATVRFDENIKLSYNTNVNSAGDVISLCRQMNKFKVLVHVSTAYSNCVRNEIDETFYDIHENYHNIGMALEKLTIEESDALTPQIVGKWPNTYTFTKALAENLIKDLGKGLPIGIFRPSIVVSTYQEPVEGWIDNFYGPTGVVAAAATGLLRILHCDQNMVADMVPVDTCVAGLIAAAWDIANKNINKKIVDIPIYNYVSSPENATTWGEYNTLNMIQSGIYPLNKAIWTPKFQTESNPFIYLLYKIFFHLLPALVIDFGTVITGHKPRLLKMYKKLHKFSDVISFFAIREWQFHNENTKTMWRKMNMADRDLFPLSITTVPWLIYFRIYFKGIRVHLLQDPLNNLDDARAKKRRFDVLHAVLKFVLNFIIAITIWTIIAYLWIKLLPTMDFNQTTACYSTTCNNRTNT